jgi:Tfp pilus assembly protein PilF
MSASSRALALVALAFYVPAFALLPPKQPPPAQGKLPTTGLAPAKVVPGLCVLKYRVSTSSPECQSFFDQALGYFYSYVWMEAARSFETAARNDPDCAMAWWGLSRATEHWGHGDANKPLLKANELQARASHREQQLILARMQERGLAPGVGDAEARKRAAIQTLDTMLTLYDDDQEAWYYRAQLAGGSGLFGGQASAVPYYKALCRINPLHPGANHELVHFYENCRRPALGWVYAENYIRSSPGIPHAFHMQAHLATRLGRWEKTSDRSARAIDLERAYHKEMNVTPREDHQFSHHLEILTLSLIHDGRFAEARAVKAEAQAAGFEHRLSWYRLYLAERRWGEALKIVEQFRKTDKTTAAYLAALAYLKQGDVNRARPEVEVLRQAQSEHKDDSKLRFRLWETQGLLMCSEGSPAAGVRLLERAADRSKDDYSHHAWGNGAYYMESWGAAALQAGLADIAEEAFLEALAHDAGSARAALGLQVLCERQGRAEEAKRYARMARQAWGRADPEALQCELSTLRQEISPRATQRARGEEGPDGATVVK